MDHFAIYVCVSYVVTFKKKIKAHKHTNNTHKAHEQAINKLYCIPLSRETKV